MTLETLTDGQQAKVHRHRTERDDRYRAEMPDDMRARLERAGRAVSQSVDAAETARAAADRARTELIDARVREAPDKRLAQLEEAWQAAEDRATRAARQVEFNREVADRIEAEYLAHAHAAEVASASAEVEQARADYVAAYGRLGPALAVVREVGWALETASKAEAAALKRRAALNDDLGLDAFRRIEAERHTPSTGFQDLTFDADPLLAQLRLQPRG